MVVIPVIAEERFHTYTKSVPKTLRPDINGFNSSDTLTGIYNSSCSENTGEKNTTEKM